VTWGWFQGGFRPSSVAGSGVAACATAHNNIGGVPVVDYSAHHEPFMYYASTANPHHLAPTSTAAIGQTDRANHQYDLLDFDAAVRANNLPQVSFLKAASFEDAHPGYSDPLDEQHFVARTLDELEQSPDWSSTAVVIAYDDSDGWYDHRHTTILQHSNAASDDTICNSVAPGAGEYLDRCGPGPRLPLLVISPYVTPNTVGNTQLEQTSIIHFIEDNWLGGTRIGDQSFDARAASLTSLFDFNAGDPRAPKVYLDPSTGEVISSPPSNLGSSPDYPTPTPTATVTVTPTPTVTPPPPKPKFKPTVSVRAKRHGKRLTLTVKVSHVNAKNGPITVRVKLRRKGKTIAHSAAHRVRSGKVKLVLKARHKLKPGRYTLLVRVKQGNAAKTLTKRLTVH
jgi:phospholipase C